MKLLKLPGILVEEGNEVNVIKNGPFYALIRETTDQYSMITMTGEGSHFGNICSYAQSLGYPIISQKISLFAPHGTNTTTPDYPQGNPKEFFGMTSYLTNTIYDCFNLGLATGSSKKYRFYPNNQDKSFWVIINIHNNGNDNYSRAMGFYRSGSRIFGDENSGFSSIAGCNFRNSRFSVGGNGIIPWWGYNNNSHKYCPQYVSISGTVNAEFLHTEFTMNSSLITFQDFYSNLDEESWLRWIGDFEPPVVDDDNPYYEGGTSEEDGGGGNFSDDSDTVDEDQLPNIDAVGTGFATLFTPSKYQLNALANVMWDSNVFTALQNLVENIQNMFTSLAIVPFEVTEGQTVEVTWLGLPITNIFLTLAANQYYEFDMGSINMAEDSRIFSSGSALDYSPFSRLGIFLPFIGFQDLDIDECRDAIIGLKYRIDILSGTCVALISVNGNTIYQFSGNCLSQIPITNENMQSLVSDAVQVGIAAAATHSAAGAVGTAEAEWGAAESVSDVSKANTHIKAAESHLAQSRSGLASATANAAMGMKPTFGKAGAISASASLLAVKQPYLFLTTPRQSIPEHYQRYCGFPSNISGKLNTFSGLTVVEDIRLNGLVATSSEVAEIYKLLKSGVII